MRPFPHGLKTRVKYSRRATKLCPVFTHHSSLVTHHFGGLPCRHPFRPMVAPSHTEISGGGSTPLIAAESILDLVGRTPLLHLSRFAPPPLAGVYAKLEYMNPGGSVKD